MSSESYETHSKLSAAKALARRGFEKCRFGSPDKVIYEGTSILIQADKTYASDPDISISDDALRVKLHLAFWLSKIDLDPTVVRRYAGEAVPIARELKQRRLVVQAALISGFGWRAGLLVGPLP
jgi:hypothetical protein